jgi:murein DD-endopeptidase MepM/ murein hydrolase activator NlpD
MLGCEQKILTQNPSAEGSGFRFRIMTLLAALPLFGMVAAFGIAPQTQTEIIPLHRVVEELALPQLDPIATTGTEYWREELVRRGDTLPSLLSRLQIHDPDALRFFTTNEIASRLYRLKPGSTIQVAASEGGKLLRLRHLTQNGELLRVERIDNGFSVHTDAAPFQRYLTIKAGEIRSSLFQATDAAQVPDNIAAQIVEIFSSEIDFYQDLRAGDRFAVIYEVFHANGEAVKTGRVLAAEFTNQGERHQAVYYRPGDGEGGYYSFEGINLRKAFLRSPLEFSRISSGFSSARLHPVLQSWRAHKGIDYAAPAGTPVRATADGVVAFSGTQNGYGKLVILEHHGKYSTAYGHLSGFASGVRKGSRIAQGDVIGYVGATGYATGPHLHYEFRVNGMQLDPSRIPIPSAMPITPQLWPDFDKTAGALARQLTLVRGSHLARLN